MGLQIRDFVPVGADLATICHIWNEAVAPESELYLHMTPELLAERLAGRSGAHRRICLLAQAQGEAIGLAVGTVTPAAAPEAANLACVAVLPQARGHGIGSALLAEIEERSRAAGCTKLKVGSASQVRLAHGVDPTTPGHLWLLHKGFRVAKDELFMRMAFGTWQMPGQIQHIVESLCAQGVDFRIATKGDLPGLMATAREFSDHLPQVFQDNVTGAKGAPVLIATESGQVVGFVGPLTVSKCGFADFAFIGVSETYRGRGIGKALFYLCLDNFQERGARAFELVTDSTNPAQKLYLDAGMRLVTVLLHLEKRLGH